MEKIRINRQLFIKNHLVPRFPLPMRSSFMGKNFPIIILMMPMQHCKLSRNLRTAAVAVKHMNPCGVGTGKTGTKHLQRHLQPILFLFLVESLPLTVKLMQQTAGKLHEIFLEIIIAPSFSDRSVSDFNKQKKSSSINDSVF